MRTKIKNLFDSYNSEMKKITEFKKSPSAKQYTNEALSNLVERDRQSAFEKLKPEVEQLLKESLSNLENAKRNVFQAKYPLLTSKDPNSKLIGEMELQAAQIAVTLEADSILQELEFSKMSNRQDFINYILDNYKGEQSIEFYKFKENFCNETKILEPLEPAEFDVKLMNYFNNNFSAKPDVIHYPIDLNIIKNMPLNVVKAQIETVNDSMAFHNS